MKYIAHVPGCGGFLTGAARGAGRGADLPENTMTIISIKILQPSGIVYLWKS